ncbi:hypothetical protein DFP73DRAFT_295592 [Morchella snyderi]|nr:hypothetical protein DFP73DRAFT_295592 [Morchella snyderi]
MSETKTTTKHSRPLSPELSPGAQAPSTPRRRRRSSTFSSLEAVNSRRNSLTLQEAKQALGSAAEIVLAPTDGESPTWHNIPFAFAVLPAIAGAFVTGGDFFITDVILLFLAAIFLHWLVKFPWEWYRASQSIASESPDLDPVPNPRPPKTLREAEIRAAAVDELLMHEHIALLCCFIGPIVGGLMLHMIRGQLSRPSGGLISNFNLSTFVLAAELRPSAQLVKLIRTRTKYLQSTVHHPPPAKVDLLGARIDELQAEVKELTLLATRAIERDPDLDALNRAVRRYEKKEALHSLHTETRIHEIDARLNDILTLAAAASARQKEQTLAGVLLQWSFALLVAPVSFAWSVVSLPAKAVETIMEMKKGRLLLGPSSSGKPQGRLTSKSQGRQGKSKEKERVK